jgi:hypothetical protein
MSQTIYGMPPVYSQPLDIVDNPFVPAVRLVSEYFMFSTLLIPFTASNNLYTATDIRSVFEVYWPTKARANAEYKVHQHYAQDR